MFTPYIYENPNRFRIVPVTGDVDYSDLRWTLDTPEDLAFIRAIYQRMDNVDRFSWRDVLSCLEREPQFGRIEPASQAESITRGVTRSSLGFFWSGWLNASLKLGTKIVSLENPTYFVADHFSQS